ncbi:DoxX family protein [uncultured Amnibacterium sp.]|uniref:DoxX family protein n=1 Tax=uncultured Amnibacterium sp. TaxID=1631851 RepID=UPI0035CC228D
MLIALWIVSAVAALAFLAAGGMKLARPREALVAGGMGWAADYTPPVIKLIAAAEVLGALGLVLPLATRIAPALAPAAGFALAILMIGAAVVHLRRQETPVPPLVLAALALASAILGIVVLL